MLYILSVTTITQPAEEKTQGNISFIYVPSKSQVNDHIHDILFGLWFNVPVKSYGWDGQLT